MSTGSKLAGISIDRSVPTAPFHQLYSALKRRILEGHFRPGEQLPPVSVLCPALKVSRATLSRAIRELARDGLVNARAGAATVVAERKPATTEIWIITMAGRRYDGCDPFFHQITEGLELGFRHPQRRYATTITNGHSYTAQEVLATARGRGADSLAIYTLGETVPEAMEEVAGEIPCVALLPKYGCPRIDHVVADVSHSLQRLLRSRYEQGRRRFVFLGRGYTRTTAMPGNPYFQLVQAYEGFVRQAGLTPVMHWSSITPTTDRGEQDREEQRLVSLLGDAPAGATVVAETASMAHGAVLAHPSLDVITFTERQETAEFLRSAVCVLYIGLEMAARESVSLLQLPRGGQDPREVRVQPLIMDRDGGPVACKSGAQSL